MTILEGKSALIIKRPTLKNLEPEKPLELLIGSKKKFKNIRCKEIDETTFEEYTIRRRDLSTIKSHKKK